MGNLESVYWVIGILTGGFGSVLLLIGKLLADQSKELQKGFKEQNEKIHNQFKEHGDQLRGEIKDLRTEIKKDQKEECDTIRSEIKDLRREVQDMDRRICRIEGSLASKDCCMLKESRSKEQAQ